MLRGKRGQTGQCQFVKRGERTDWAVPVCEEEREDRLGNASLLRTERGLTGQCQFVKRGEWTDWAVPVC